jgi:deoxyadenosine/deoxycytidine kinase
MPLIYSIEGNIGSGKSTLLANLRNRFENPTKTSEETNTPRKIIFVKEPVDEWESIQDGNGITMLEKFYNDQDKYSFPFQMMAYISRLALLKEAIKNNPEPDTIIITERCLYTDKYVFAKMLYDSGKIEDVCYQIYNKWFDTFASELPIEGVIYVKTNPDICNKRILLRSRNGESSIPLSYLENCHTYHNNMITVLNTETTNSKLLELNGNVDIFENKDQINKWILEIEKFIL